MLDLGHDPLGQCPGRLFGALRMVVGKQQRGRRQGVVPTVLAVQEVVQLPDMHTDACPVIPACRSAR